VRYKKILILVIVIIIIISVYSDIYYYNATNYKSLNLDINNADFKVRGYAGMGNINVSATGNIMKISSSRNNSGNWIDIDSKNITVNPGWQILLIFSAEYKNTVQTALRILGISSNNAESVLGYAMIVEGNSGWQYYNVLVKIPNFVHYIILQITLGWVILKNVLEILSITDMSLYNVA